MRNDPDPRIFDAKQITVSDLIDRLGIARLNRVGNELRGPCPLCGGTKRFDINATSAAFLCRTCGIKGGDQIALAQQVLNLTFPDALTWLCGDAPASLDPEEVDRRRARAKAADEKQRAETERYRQKAIADARAIWGKTRPARLGVVGAYLKARGLTPDLLPDIPDCLRFVLDFPYVKKIGGRFETLHRSPVMVAAILSAEGDLNAVHQTWVDNKPPHGKASIVWNGTTYPSKLVRGSKKGGAIRLHTPPGAHCLVMGEGIETTLSALAVDAIPGAAYWAGVDLGNMAGRMEKPSPAEKAAGLKYSGRPDLEDLDAFLPPPWVKRLVYIQDGDSDPAATRAKLESGLRRAVARARVVDAEIVHAGDGVDLNDVLAGAVDPVDGFGKPK